MVSRSLYVLAVALPALAAAATADFCSIGTGQKGVCMGTSSCRTSGGQSTPGFCPGSADYQCCTYGGCKVDGYDGWCIPSGACVNAKLTANQCPGNSDIQCCTYGACKTKNEPAQAGKCGPKSTCGGTPHAGLCPGPSGIQCCTEDEAAPAPSPTGGSGCTQIWPYPNDETIQLIKDSEGYDSNPYVESGNPTVGWGHLCASVGCPDVLTKFHISAYPLTTAQAEAIFKSDATEAARCITQVTKACVVLNEYQFGALVDLAFQNGCPTVENSALMGRLNACENPKTVVTLDALIQEFGGSAGMGGINKRRAAEYNLFQKSGKATLPAGKTC